MAAVTSGPRAALCSALERLASPTWPIWIALVCVLLVALAQYASPRPVAGVPYARFWTPLGHVPAMLRHITRCGELSSFWHAQIAEHGLRNERGEAICQVLMGPGEAPWIIVSGHEAVQDILSVHVPTLALADDGRPSVRPSSIVRVWSSKPSSTRPRVRRLIGCSS